MVEVGMAISLLASHLPRGEIGIEMSETLHLYAAAATAGRSMVAPTLFGQLAPDLREQLHRAAPLRAFSDGAIIQQRGDTPTGFWLIECGRVTVGQFLTEGHFRALAVLGPGDSYGELALFSGRRRVVDAVARGAAELQEMLEVVASLRRGSASRRIAAMLAATQGHSRRLARYR